MKNTKDILYFMRLPVIFLIIVVVGLYLILIANGYIFNFQAKTIEQTGMISLKSNPKNVSVYLNNIWKADKTPLKIPELTNGRYDVKISQDGYQDWEKTFYVEAGLVSADENVILFLKEPVEMPITDDEKEAFKKLPNNLLNNNIEIKDGSEIWINSLSDKEEDTLITRLSQPIKKVTYYSDKKHILFQSGKEVRVIDIDGTNNIKLAELSNENLVEFFVDDSGKYLYYQVDNDLKKIQIH